MINIFLLLIIITNLLFTNISFKVYKMKMNPMSLNSVWWTINLIISSLGLYGMYKPSMMIYFIVFLATTAFNMGSLIRMNRTRVTIIGDDNFVGSVNYKKLIIINLVALIFIMPYTAKAVKILVQSGPAVLRATSLTVGGLGTSMLTQVMLEWIVTGVFNATVIIAVILFTLNKNKNLMLLAILDIIIYTLTFSGRWILYRALVVICISYILLNGTKNKKFIIKDLNRERILNDNQNTSKRKRKKSKRNLLLIISSSVVFLAIITFNRTFEGMSFFGNIVIYFTGSFVMLDSILSQNDFFSVNQWLFGGASIAGITQPILAGFSFITGIEIVRADEIVLGITALNYQIGENIIFNAFATSNYMFIRDFGILGCVVIPFVFGFVISGVYKKLIFKKRLFTYILYVFLMYVIISSTMQWDFVSAWTWFAILFIYICIDQRKL